MSLKVIFGLCLASALGIELFFLPYPIGLLAIIVYWISCGVIGLWAAK